MEDAALVGVMNRFGDNAQVTRGLAGRQRTIDEHFREAFALDIFHGEVVLALDNADFVDADNVWMRKRGGGRSLGAKALHKVGTGERAEEQHLHRHDSVEARLARFVNDAHPAAGDFFDQLVLTKCAGKVRTSVILDGEFIELARLSKETFRTNAI